MKKRLGIMTILTVIGLSNSVLAADTMRYVCQDGQTFTAAYPNEDQAVINYQSQLFLLNIAESANGARYVGEGFQLWTQGATDATLSVLPQDKTIVNDGLTCKAVAKTSAITTRTNE